MNDQVSKLLKGFVAEYFAAARASLAGGARPT
jgi:hypothetical protein